MRSDDEIVKRARNPKRTSSQYSCTKTFVSPESGSFTTGRRVRTRDHYHQRDTHWHNRTTTGPRVMIVDGRGGSRTSGRGARVHEITRRNVQVSEYRGGRHEEIVCLSDRSFPIIFNRDGIAMGGGGGGGGRAVGKKGEKRRFPPRETGGK